MQRNKGKNMSGLYYRIYTRLKVKVGRANGNNRSQQSDKQNHRVTNSTGKRTLGMKTKIKCGIY